METTSQRSPLLSLAAALLLAGCAPEAPPPGTPHSPSGRTVWQPEKPLNVVLILIDTLRGDVLVDREGKYDTPNLDRLASDGVVYPNAFSTAPMTLPSHVSMFSSRSPSETKVLNNGQVVPRDLPLLADWMGDHGYDTRAVISLGTLNPPGEGKGVSRGFKSYDWDYWMMSQAETTHTRLLASLAKRQAEKPLFLFAHFSDPHEPYNSHGSEDTKVELKMDGKLLEDIVTSDMAFWTKEVTLSPGRTVFEFSMPAKRAGRFRVRLFECWEGDKELDVTWEEIKPMDRVKSAVLAVDRGDRPAAKCKLRLWMNDVPPNDDSRRSRYAHEINYVDQYVGQLLTELDQMGLYQDSLIVFTSDHGEAMGEHRFFGHAKGLTDEQIHVPLLIKLPANDPRREELARTAASLVSHLDTTPTILELAGLPPLPGQRGLSILEPHTRVCVAQTHQPEADKNQVAMRDERYKLIYFPDAEASEQFVLYDLVNDPGELENVFAQSGKERPDWPDRLRLLYSHSNGEYEGAGSAEDLEAQNELLRALGYAGAEADVDPPEHQDKP